MDPYAVFRQLADFVSSSPEACQYLAKSVFPVERQLISVQLNEQAAILGLSAREKILDNFISWCGNHRIGLSLQNVLAERDALKDRVFHLHRDLAKNLWLSPQGKEGRLRNFLAQIPMYDVDALAEPYPPVSWWVAESAAIAALWRDDIRYGKQADCRIPRKNLMLLDDSKLEHEVYANRSEIYVDKGEIILIVLRDFCKDPRVVQWVDNIIRECISVKKSIRVSAAFFLVISSILTLFLVGG
jgi:hypothetical protein